MFPRDSYIVGYLCRRLYSLGRLGDLLPVPSAPLILPRVPFPLLQVCALGEVRNVGRRKFFEVLPANSPSAAGSDRWHLSNDGSR